MFHRTTLQVKIEKYDKEVQQYQQCTNAKQHSPCNIFVSQMIYDMFGRAVSCRAMCCIKERHTGFNLLSLSDIS